MADDRVQVHIDDFVVGDVPDVSVLSGLSPDGLVEFESDSSVFRGWWLWFLLLGPLGILVIAVLLVVSPRAVPVKGLLPVTRDELDQSNLSALRSHQLFWALVPGVFALLVLLLWIPAASLAVQIVLAPVLAAIVGSAAIAAVRRLKVKAPRIEVRSLAGGRWVEVMGAHPEFVEAVERHNRDRHRSRFSTDEAGR